MPCTSGFVNTVEFSPHALGKEICPPRKSNEYEYREYWRIQQERCINGYTIGGVNITGEHYFYLNYIKILRVVDGSKRKKWYVPRFIDLDYDFFHSYRIARFIENKLGLPVTGSRQRGKTYKSASLATYELVFQPRSQTVIVSYESDYGYDTFLKVKSNLDGLVHTEFFKRRLKADDEMIKIGYKLRDNLTKEYIESGFLSELHLRVAKNNPQCTIGLTPSLVLREEAGKFNNYDAQYNYMRDQIVSEGQSTGFILDFGTGGEMTKGGSYGLKNSIYAPDKYDYHGFNEDWGEHGEYLPNSKKKVGFFIPAWRGLIMDDQGNSMYDKSIEIIKANQKKYEDDPVEYATRISQEPVNIEQSFWIPGEDIFNIRLLNKRLSDIVRTDSLNNMVQKGNLEWIRDSKGNIIDVEWIPNINGPFQIIEHPEWTLPENQRKLNVNKNNGWNVYISGCDSYDADSSTTDSEGSIFIYKRFIHPGATGDLFVAQYTGRPDADEFYEGTAKLNWYYKARMLFEATNLGIKTWYINNNMVQYLKEKPQVAYSDIKDSKANYTYGLQMPIHVKEYCIRETKKWIDKLYENLFFKDQIQDLIKFTRETNHDRTISTMLCIVHNLDTVRIKVDNESKPTYNHKSIVVKKINGVLKNTYK